jgi:EmrB/QacA subfamily drug resistance transporter
MATTASPAQRTHYRMTLAVLILSAIAYALLQSLVLPALPAIQRSLHVSDDAVTWVLTTYLLSASVATPTVGRLGDMYGKHRVLGVVMVILAIGTLVSAVAASLPLLLAGRVLQGIGGGIFPLGFGIIRDESPPARVAGGIGLMSSMIGIGGGAGVVLSGVIVEHLSYHWLFWLPLAVILAATVAVYVVVPASPVRVPGRVNWAAASLMSAGLTIVLVATSEAISWGWGSPKTLGLLLIGVAALTAWVVIETRSGEPLVDMRMMRGRAVWTTNLVAFLIGVGMYSSFILIPQYVQEPATTGYGFGASVFAAGVFLLPCTLAMLIVGQFTGALDRLIGSRATLICGAAFSASSFLVLTTTPTARWEIYLASAMLGMGTGLAFAALPNLIVQNVRQDQTGVATGMNTVMRTLGGALGGQIAATFLAASLAASGLPSASGYGLAFGLCAGAVLVALVASLLIPTRERAHVMEFVPIRTEASSAPGQLAAGRSLT